MTTPTIVREYLDAPEPAQTALEAILKGLERGGYQNLIALDIETAPKLGYLEPLYPTLLRNSDEDEGKVGKSKYRKYVAEVAERNFDFKRFSELADEVVALPRKLSGKEKGELALQGANANKGWAILFDQVKRNRDKIETVWSGQLPWQVWYNAFELGEADKTGQDVVKPGLDPFSTDIFLIQIAVKDNQDRLLNYCFNCFKTGLEPFKSFFEQAKDYLFLGQNLKFDILHLLNSLGVCPRNVIDTRVLSRILTLGLRQSHSLNSLAERYLGIDLDKSVRNTFVGVRIEDPTPEQIEYAFGDTEILFPLCETLCQRLEQNEQLDVALDFCLQSYSLALFSLKGYDIDADTWVEISKSVIAQRDEAALEVYRLLGQEPNFKLTQRQVVCSLLTEVLGFEVTSTGKDELATYNLRYLEENGKEHPFFTAWKVWTTLDKAASTYGESFLFWRHPLTGRYHPNFTIAGADTGRDTSDNPNLLNQPRPNKRYDIRKAYKAPPGYYLLGADYSNIEVRAAVDATKDQVYTRIFNEDLDGHSIIAAFMFHTQRTSKVKELSWTDGSTTLGADTFNYKVLNIPDSFSFEQYFELAKSADVLAQVSKEGTRQISKVAGFLKGYGGNKFTGAQRLGVSVDRADEFFRLYDTILWELEEGMQKLGRVPFETRFRINGWDIGYSEAYNNLRRYYVFPKQPKRANYPQGDAGWEEFKEAQRAFRAKERAIQRKARNAPFQSGVAVVMNEATLVVQREIEKLGGYVWLRIYDEVIVAVPESVDEEVVKKLLVDCLKPIAEKYITTVPVKVDPNKSKSYYWAKG